MVIGFILISTSPSREQEVLQALTRMPQVKEAELLFGEYDIILKVEAGSMDELARIVLKKIRKVPGVLDTETLSGMESL
ncbi:MAG: Lrp/AsnC family transcriptional regulator [Thermoplasmatota archaeon]